MAPADAWLPDATLVRLESITAETEGLTLVLAARRNTVPCPSCGRLSDRVHSRYFRTIADLPWRGWPVRLRLQTRRFFCNMPNCATRIFAERLPGVVAHYARRTSRQNHLLEFLASLQRDEVAMRTGLAESWSNGPVECPVNRLKLIKRQMYGRASFALLRARVLPPAWVRVAGAASNPTVAMQLLLRMGYPVVIRSAGEPIFQKYPRKFLSLRARWLLAPKPLTT